VSGGARPSGRLRRPSPDSPSCVRACRRPARRRPALPAWLWQAVWGFACMGPPHAEIDLKVLVVHATARPCILTNAPSRLSTHPAAPSAVPHPAPLPVHAPAAEHSYIHVRPRRRPCEFGPPVRRVCATRVPLLQPARAQEAGSTCHAYAEALAWPLGARVWPVGARAAPAEGPEVCWGGVSPRGQWSAPSSRGRPGPPAASRRPRPWPP
jgi:hypothetical protein